MKIYQPCSSGACRRLQYRHPNTHMSGRGECRRNKRASHPGILSSFAWPEIRNIPLVSKQETAVLTDNHRKRVWPVSLAVRLVWAPFWSGAQAGSTMQSPDKWSITLVYSLYSASYRRIHVDGYHEMTPIKIHFGWKNGAGAEVGRQYREGQNSPASSPARTTALVLHDDRASLPACQIHTRVLVNLVNQ